MFDQIYSLKIHESCTFHDIQVTSPPKETPEDDNNDNDDTGGKMVPRLDTCSNTEAELLREELKEALRSREHTKKSF